MAANRVVAVGTRVIQGRNTTFPPKTGACVRTAVTHIYIIFVVIPCSLVALTTGIHFSELVFFVATTTTAQSTIIIFFVEDVGHTDCVGTGGIGRRVGIIVARATKRGVGVVA